MPPPDFLQAVCCKSGHECCPVDQKARFPRFKCCESSESCDIVDSKGTCVSGHDGNGTTPHGTHQLDFGGQCPEDGSLPLSRRCSLNKFIQGADCPTDSHCVLDLSDNVNSGVCCRKSGCEEHIDCVSCVVNGREQGSNDRDVNAPCGWLSQGSLANAAPRCVANCRNFPDRSCIVPSDGHFCPKSDTNPNGTVVNTGTCDRRCNMVGTGRSSGINNNGNHPAHAQAEDATECCKKYKGDYCCDAWGHRAAHCAYGQNPGQGSLCGVPVRGTANTLYNSPSPYGPSPNPYQHGGPGYYNPFPRPMPYGPRPYGFAPRPYGGMYGFRDGLKTEQGEENKQLYFRPAPMYRPVMPPRRPNIVDQPPTPFVCSCDSKCNDYDDCCDDFDMYCSHNDVDSSESDSSESSA